MSDKQKPMNEKMKGIVNAIGVIAEMTLLFYRNALGAGATPDEAIKLTQAFIGASLFGNNGNVEQDSES